ncbi:PhzF family phenazine biosynthesis protein [Paenibacillus methanolicus]|uniref:PhzF family phenazine biosynthesis protein n=1 Tax=Paenibacillus methanolicus TaxID=582686 RepID=A0A5S5C561_9BACL|nr:PhzF family phenazine biosynthesis protein [Paenibacillus methanolicus]TYP73748.1 PhzF family phenazine biosynthesis protein [Paenibacillus methanolicus]
MAIPIALIDAFASVPFGGNPAAVCWLEEKKDEDWMQKTAAELNAPETAFLEKSEDGYSLRWFAPTGEIERCGHSTLAAAHFVYEQGMLDQDVEVRFHTRCGLLTATKRENGIRLDFPAEPAEREDAPEELIQALGLIPRFVGRNRIGVLIEVDGEATVRTLKPDLILLSRLHAQAVMVTSRGREHDFVSRVFLPAYGIDEDAVSGFAYGALAPYWQRRLRKDVLLAYQASRRGGELGLQLAQDRVFITGSAVTIMTGHLLT